MTDAPAVLDRPAFSALAARLLSPAAAVPLDALSACWVTATIEATVPGHGALAGDLVLMARIRGALGRALMEGASAEAIAEKACPWEPPCALDVLFREQVRSGRHGVPKPWVLALDRRGLDLVVRITLFGFAIDWAGAVGHALVTALRRGIDFHDRAAGLFLPAPTVSRLVVRENGIASPPPRETVLLDLVTPLDATGDDPLDRPASVIGRLARRIDSMARWMDVSVDADWPVLAAHWNALDYDAGGLLRDRLDSRSGRQRDGTGAHRRFARPLLSGTLAIGGDLAPVWPLLVLGETCHAGRGATAGLGRYRLG
ncbi:hypothetical protein A33M_1555 [Rhodovulum sp. PH10]|uniref:CRISPR system precrRNA processing endoribonuclease RAMP protein Cas6 n=1 Tax=Rhodovulum sp. PH10 TaxID=1187851 RepID=UPI00027C2124|nr:CRISPR system precrRNA processing endoribonuclease RAMP protein Cas6 [Rhodovulum sp. PH10]EJW09345.1 hypothetical protein A33M_1555 [Rhodovulum sp. PH10]